MPSTAARALFLFSTTIALAACSGSNDAPAPAATPDAPTAMPAAPAAMVTLAEYATPPSPAGGNCALDAINGGAGPTTTAAAGSDLSIVGWFANAQNAVPTDASLVLTGASQSYAGTLPAGGDRPDVAQALGSESARMSGFNAQVSLAGVAPGDYTLSVVYPGATPVACGLNKTVSVAAGG